MIIINELNKKSIKPVKYVISDFDRTISTGESDSSWDLFRKSNFVAPSFKIESDKLFDIYRPLEISNDISLEEKYKHMEDWALLQFELLKKYVSCDLFNYIINKDIIKLRYDFKMFVDLLYEKNIPLYIVSGGLYQPIYNLLEKNDCLNELVQIISNKIIFDKNEIVDISRPIIHSQNKKEIDLKLNKNDLGLLFGDLPKDIDIGNGLNTINCAFLNDQDIKNYNKFNVVLTGESSFNNVSKLLIKK